MIFSTVQASLVLISLFRPCPCNARDARATCEYLLLRNRKESGLGKGGGYITAANGTNQTATDGHVAKDESHPRHGDPGSAPYPPLSRKLMQGDATLERSAKLIPQHCWPAGDEGGVELEGAKRLGFPVFQAELVRATGREQPAIQISAERHRLLARTPGAVWPENLGGWRRAERSRH